MQKRRKIELERAAFEKEHGPSYIVSVYSPELVVLANKDFAKMKAELDQAMVRN